MKLRQIQFLKGTREFEIIDDTIYVQMKGLLKGEKSTIGLSSLDPEPVVNGSEMEFHGRSRRGPLLSLLLNKPSAEEFKGFVDTLKQRILEVSGDVAGAGAVTPDSFQPEAPGWNVYEEPPEFDETDQAEGSREFQPVNAERVDADIAMLKLYLNEEDIRPLLTSLEALRAEPDSEAAFQKLVDTYNGLGFQQGAVLTYAPYLKVMLSPHIWS